MKNEKCWYKNVCTNECEKSCVRFNVMSSLCQHSMLPENLWLPTTILQVDEDIDSFEDLTEVKQQIDSFVKKGGDLLIYSRICGNGKTTWAINILISYFNKVWHTAGFEPKGVFINVISFLLNNKQQISNPTKEFNTLLDNIKTVPLVVWDDIGSSSLSEYDSNFIFDLISERHNKGLSNIYTTNCNHDRLKTTLNERLFSRIWNNSFKVQLKGTDKRGQL